ncbi:MAG: type IV secretion system DNA-binding domain-containing protein [Candidatus Acidiferrales bacterium]
MTSRWTPLQNHYFGAYFSSSGNSGSGSYPLLFVHYPDGWHMAANRDVVIATPAQNRAGIFALSNQAQREGADALQWRPFFDLPNATAAQWLRQRVYDGKSPWYFIRVPVLSSLAFVGLLLAAVIYLDRKAKRERKQGHIIRGPSLVTPSEFNLKKLSDGIGFETAESITGFGRPWGPRSKLNIVRIPHHEENSHFVLAGDSGTGKSSLMRQILTQVRERGETAVVYDPALEFTPQFFDPVTDVLLNPTDQRMPFWTPSDEVQYPAEALALAGSLFPDKPHENTFFTESARKIFAHLLRYRPTPQDLTAWMKNMNEVDRRIAGTELEAMVPVGAAGQRAAVQGTFNQAAAAFQLLPKASEAKGRWSAAAWAKDRQGWLFLPSTPTQRESLRPLLSMWLDSLILRLMEFGQKGVPPVWFILDELASLQQLPQLPTVITESRKANVCLVLGFQGRSQLEALYGLQAEAMLSQPMTKIFLRTSEPHAAEWISKSIGDVEVMRLEQSFTEGFPAILSPNKSSRTSSWQRRTEPLVMASTIAGLRNLAGYLKSQEFVVPISFPYSRTALRQPGFIPRPLPDLEVLSVPEKAQAAAATTAGPSTPREQQNGGHGPQQEFEIFE